MNDDVREGDPESLVTDVEKSLLLRRATTLAAVVFWPGLGLLFLVMVFAQSIFWEVLGVWLISLVAVFIVRWLVANRYEAAKVRQFVHLRSVENARTPLGQTTAYGSGLAFAADDARIRSEEIGALAKSTKAAVDKTNQPVEEVKSPAEYRRSAEASQRRAVSIGATAMSDDDTKARCAQWWLDAAEGFRLAGDTHRAREAGRQASILNPYVLPEKPETPAS